MCRGRGGGRGDLTIFRFALVSPMTAAFAKLPHGRVQYRHHAGHFFATIRHLPAVRAHRDDLRTLVGHRH
jgi:hypothetical protein